MNRREFCGSDLQWRELRLADLDGRADCIRDGNSITLHRVFVPSVECGRKISLARFDRRVRLLRKLTNSQHPIKTCGGILETACPQAVFRFIGRFNGVRARRLQLQFAVTNRRSGCNAHGSTGADQG